MSHVCETLVFASTLEEEHERDAELRALVMECAGEQSLRLCSEPEAGDWYGGTKAWQGNLWAGAINYLDIATFLERLPTAVRWEHPDCVRIVMMDEHEDVPQMLKLGEPYSYAAGRIL